MIRLGGEFGRTTRDEVYDWLAEEQRQQSNEVVPRQAGPVNSVTGHGVDCVCPRCPGWYEARRRGIVVDVTEQPRQRMVQARPASALLDQVVPVCCLLATVTVCGVVLLPVAMPMVAMGMVMVVAMVIALVVGAIVAVYLVASLKRATGGGGGQAIRGEVVKRRRSWTRR